MDYMPNYFLITDCSVEEAMLRLGERGKKDNAIYETEEFQRILRDVYLGNKKLFVEGRHLTLQEFLENKGRIQKTKYFFISTEGTLNDTNDRVLKFLKEHIKS
jgi:thymidylate kinase